MNYKFYENSKQALENTIRKYEEDHYQTSIDLTVAESLRDDENILKLRTKLKNIELVLSALYEL